LSSHKDKFDLIFKLVSSGALQEFCSVVICEILSGVIAAGDRVMRKPKLSFLLAYFKCMLEATITEKCL